jgi:hypothetical protein
MTGYTSCIFFFFLVSCAFVLMWHELPAGLGGGGGDWRVAVELQYFSKTIFASRQRRHIHTKTPLLTTP